MSETAPATHSMEPVTDPAQLPKPTLQPGLLPADGVPRFSSTELLWWNNGLWGDAGYAVPNPSGKHVTKNSVMHEIHSFIGLELFALMHEPDVKFRRPPNASWLHSVAKMVKLGRKRMNDRRISWNDDRKGDADHTTNTLKDFVVFPVPYFGGRVRNAAAQSWCGICLVLLSELQQHSDNDFDADVTDFTAALVDDALSRIQYDIATMFLGISREDAMKDGFVLPEITPDTYKPDALFTEAEMVDERPPATWWPTASDLSPIRGIPSSVAHAYSMRWPVSGEAFYGDFGAHENAFPGLVVGKTYRPGSRQAEKK